MYNSSPNLHNMVRIKIICLVMVKLATPTAIAEHFYKGYVNLKELKNGRDVIIKASKSSDYQSERFHNLLFRDNYTDTFYQMKSRQKFRKYHHWSTFKLLMCWRIYSSHLSIYLEGLYWLIHFSFINNIEKNHDVENLKIFDITLSLNCMNWIK